LNSGLCDWEAGTITLEPFHQLFFVVVVFGIFFCVCVVLGLELRAFTLSYSTSPFFFLMTGIFEIGSLKIFVQAGFEL
jgi:hypothetical protein